MQNVFDTSSNQSSKASYFTVKDAANYLSVSIFTFYRLLKEPDGPPHLKIMTNKKKKPTIRISKKDFLLWIKQNEK